MQQNEDQQINRELSEDSFGWSLTVSSDIDSSRVLSKRLFASCSTCSHMMNHIKHNAPMFWFMLVVKEKRTRENENVDNHMHIH